MTLLDNIHLIKIEEQEKEIQKLKELITALNNKMELIYNNWNYDYIRFQQLKEKCTKNIQLFNDLKLIKWNVYYQMLKTFHDIIITVDS